MKNDKFQEYLSGPGIIVAKDRYRAAARRLRNTNLETSTVRGPEPTRAVGTKKKSIKIRA